MTNQPFSSRIKRLTGGEPDGTKAYVLYWMQASQRVGDNPALSFAATEADYLGMPLQVVFVLNPDYPEANLRHFTFMLEGINGVRTMLHDMGVGFALRLGDPVKEVLGACEKAAVLVMDTGYLKHQKAWRREISENAPCPVVQVEGDVAVPVETVSGKAEFAARTIRPKINKILDDHLWTAGPVRPSRPMETSFLHDTDTSHLAEFLGKTKVNKSIEPVTRWFTGGEREARDRFEYFMSSVLPRYAEDRNRPEEEAVSFMGPYLHFGQISPLYMVNRIRSESRGYDDAEAAFIEELVVRRELAINFVHFTPDYDAYDSLPNWAKETLAVHALDKRDPVYDMETVEKAETHDPYFNAAMNEMRVTGYMHNYMRMYWGKKILEWSETPREAHHTILTLNNKYFLDGRDPNSYAGAAWVLGLHDRPFKERAIYGKVRCMMASGLKRKCRIDEYVSRITGLL